GDKSQSHLVASYERQRVDELPTAFARAQIQKQRRNRKIGKDGKNTWFSSRPSRASSSSLMAAVLIPVRSDGSENKGRFTVDRSQPMTFLAPSPPGSRIQMRPLGHPERWQSGRMCVIGNHVYPQGYRGFES